MTEKSENTEAARDFRPTGVTNCKTVTNSKITRDKHGVTKSEVRRPREDRG